MQLTIAIATWNRSALLGQTLAALAQVRRPADTTLQVLVCDNNSTDATRQTIEAAAAALGATYLFEPRQGKSQALNRMIEQARGDWVLFLDDDVLAPPQLLEAYVAGMHRHPGAVSFGGPILPWLPRPLSGRRAWLVAQYPGVFGVLGVPQDTAMRPPTVSAWGANMMIRREALPAGGFDPDRGIAAGVRIAGEDVALIGKLLEAGGEGWLLPEAGVRHYLPFERTGGRAFGRWQVGHGRTWRLTRGAPAPGKWGVAWWAWRGFGRRAVRAAALWRPWPTRAYYDALAAACHYWGYLRG
jgi:glycosyltransferase involved in cell wall biosynthesis